ncbi:trifunctional dihydropteroate synthetase [Linderina macrospora]|uniref:Trifunctional dihydropteroate synthetase n=1 Tax=Linderina macrospora TaxID=4868 RepID=A0ACC1JBT5_9FUNG|nr:trifunctional dihydropteroate synthetase [Linderina macrospora]
MADKIIFRDLEVRAVLGHDSWERKKSQPLVITAEIHTSIASAGRTDKVTESVHYGNACKRVMAFAESEHKLQSLEALAEGIVRTCLGVTERALAVHVIARKPRALLHAKYAGVEVFRTRKEVFGSWGADPVQETGETDDEFAQRSAAATAERLAAERAAGELATEDRIVVRKLSLSTIIGVNLWERHAKQIVDFDLTMHYPKPTYVGGAGGVVRDSVPAYRNFRTVVEAITELVEKSSYRTVEALATAIARTGVKECRVPKLTVRVEKPSALVFAACSAVEITRTTDDFAAPLVDSLTPSSGSADAQSDVASVATSTHGMHNAYVALGTNVGDRLANLHRALTLLNTTVPNTQLAETSFLYETAPMYVTDQPAFLNSACLLRTALEPLALLDELKRIEAEMGRDFSMFRNGPRVIDLDILFYDELVMATERLTIPHALVHERRFQLGPLCDINRELMHQRLGNSAAALYRHLTTHSNAPDDIVRVTPLQTRSHTGADSNEDPVVLQTMVPATQKQTIFMGILNCTPDSFSDGGDYFSLDDAVSRARQLVADGANIIDIGGQSTRPGAVQVGVEEEISRVVPVVRALRDQKITVPISIDTFYAKVAEAALDAGADIINDVTGGYFDQAMLPLVAARQCPYILMHMRGDPATMTKLNDYSQYSGDVVRGTRFELAQRVRSALDHGVARWNIILDPGIGFAKEGAQNFEILRRLPELTARHIRAPVTDRSGKPEVHGENQEGFIDENLPAELVGYPVLVGSSRKRFIGVATGKAEAKDRTWGTAATVTSAVQGGAAIVRVHDVAEMVDVARVSDCIYRAQ